MEKPIRVQRKRTKCWTMPENTVYVGRPTKWGNPFKLVGDMVYVDNWERRVGFFRWAYLCQGDIDTVLRLYKTVLTGFLQVGEYNIIVNDLDKISYWLHKFEGYDLSELRDKNLACFCSLNEPCHVDVLLEVVNK